MHSCAEKVEEKKMGNSALQHARQRNRELVTFSDSIFEVGRSTASLSSANTRRIGEPIEGALLFQGYIETGRMYEVVPTGRQGAGVSSRAAGEVIYRLVPSCTQRYFCIHQISLLVHY